MTTVKSVIQKLQQLHPDDHIIFDLFTKNDGDEVFANKFGNDELKMSQEAWLDAVDHAEKWGISDDETFREAVLTSISDEERSKLKENELALLAREILGDNAVEFLVGALSSVVVESQLDALIAKLKEKE